MPDEAGEPAPVYVVDPEEPPPDSDTQITRPVPGGDGR